MTYTTIFLFGVFAGVIAPVAVVAYLRRPLEAILLDLCGTADRARFWTAFSSAALLLFPLIFALDAHPDAGSSAPAAVAIAEQINHALTGLGLTMVALGIAIGTFILRRNTIVPDLNV